MSSDEEKLQAAIPAEFHMISGSQDRQTSADVFNVNKVQILLVAGLTFVPHNLIGPSSSIIAARMRLLPLVRTTQTSG
jgi:hypothetical protein